MHVRTIRAFVDETGPHEPGDELKMADSVALVRIKAGVVARMPEEPRTAVTPEPEMAVLRKGRR